MQIDQLNLGGRLALPYNKGILIFWGCLALLFGALFCFVAHFLIFVTNRTMESFWVGLVFDALCLAITYWAVSNIIGMLACSIRESGVIRRGLFSSSQIRWSEVQSVELTANLARAYQEGFTVILITPFGKVKIQGRWFQKQSQWLVVVLNRVPKSAEVLYHQRRETCRLTHQEALEFIQFDLSDSPQAGSAIMQLQRLSKYNGRVAIKDIKATAAQLGFDAAMLEQLLTSPDPNGVRMLEVAKLPESIRRQMQASRSDPPDSLSTEQFSIRFDQGSPSVSGHTAVKIRGDLLSLADRLGMDKSMLENALSPVHTDDEQTLDLGKLSDVDRAKLLDYCANFSDAPLAKRMMFRLYALGWKLAPRWRRILAGTLDTLISMALAFPLEVKVVMLCGQIIPYAIYHRLSIAVILAALVVTWLVVYVLYAGLLVWLLGSAPAGLLFGLRIKDLDGHELSLLTAFQRAWHAPFSLYSCTEMIGILRNNGSWEKFANSLRENTETEVVMRRKV